MVFKHYYHRIRPYIVWGLAVVFVLFQFTVQLSSGVMLNGLQESFHLSALGAGFLVSSYYYIYVLMQTPAGILIDRYGARLLIAIGALICAVGCFLFANANDFPTAEIGRILTGAGTSCAFISTLYLARNWFPIERFAFMVGLSETIGMLGVILGNFYLLRLIEQVGWRVAMFYTAGVSCLIGLLCWVFIRDEPEHSVVPRKKIEYDFWHNLACFLKSKIAWLNALYIGLMFTIVTVFDGLWGVPFIVKVYQTNIEMATIVSSLPLVGIAIGSPVMGWLYPKLEDKRKFLGLMAAISGLLFAEIILVPQQLWIAGVLLLILGFISSVYVVSFVIAQDIAPPGSSSMAIGFTNTITVLTAPILQPLIGWFLDLSATKTPEHVLHYAMGDYRIALSILPLVMLIAAALALFLKFSAQGQHT